MGLDNRRRVSTIGSLRRRRRAYEKLDSQLCPICGEAFLDEEGVYEVSFGFTYGGDARQCHFEEDSWLGLFHGRCLGLPARQNDDLAPAKVPRTMKGDGAQLSVSPSVFMKSANRNGHKSDGLGETQGVPLCGNCAWQFEFGEVAYFTEKGDISNETIDGNLLFRPWRDSNESWSLLLCPHCHDNDWTTSDI